MKRMILIVFFSLMFLNCFDINTFYELIESRYYAPLSKYSSVNKEKLDNAYDYIENKTGFEAITVLYGQDIVLSYGDVHLPINCASVRKSIFSILYGIAIEKGLINIDSTLEELGIDDNAQPLTNTEKKATVRDLLSARSGIYLPALGESETMKKKRPERGSHLPGEYFYYNNWDFNVLPMILEKQTGKKIASLMYEWLAIPTGMRYFHPGCLTYQYDNYTEYPQTRIYMSSEDLARLGSVMIQGGIWSGIQVVPQTWTMESVTPVSISENDENLPIGNGLLDGYAYLWWVDRQSGTVWGVGSGGQFLVLDKTNNLVISARNNTGVSSVGYFWYSVTGKSEENYASAMMIRELVIEALK